MSDNIRYRVRDGKLRITIDLNKKPKLSASGKALVQARVDGTFEQLGPHDEALEGYALSLTLLAPKPKTKVTKSDDGEDTVKRKKPRG